MKIDWEEPVAPQAHHGSQRAQGLWSKLRNSISVLTPEPGSQPVPPRRRSSENSSSPQAKSPSGSRSHSRGPAPQRPRVTVITNGGHAPVINQRKYSYVVESPTRSPSPRSPTSPVHRSSTPRHAGSPREPIRRHSTPHSPPLPQRSQTSPNGVMYNGKLIVGNPADVERYVSSQKNIENWVRGVR